MAHKIMASWLAGRDSWSGTVRRCLLIQATVLSMCQRLPATQARSAVLDRRGP
jgi:hypothetical protein